MDYSGTSFVSRLKEGYEKAKKPIAFILMFLVALIETIPDELLPNSAQTKITATAAFLLGIILLHITFEIYEKLQKSTLNVVTAKEAFRKIEKLIESQSEVKIQAIAVSGRHGWFSLLNDLLNEHSQSSVLGKKKFKIEVAFLNPEGETIKSKTLQKFHIGESIIEQVKQKIKNVMPNRNNGNIDVYYYDHLPNIVGFLINDNYLYMSMCYWEGNGKRDTEMRAGGAEYFIYDKNDVFGGSEYVKKFSSWMNYVKLHGEKQDFLKEITDKKPTKPNV